MLNQVLPAALLVVLAGASAAHAQQPGAPAPKAETKPEPAKPSVSGFVQFDYRRGDDAGQASAVTHEFNVRRARVTVAGDAHPRVRYSVTLQLESANAAVLDALAEVELRPLARLRVGQYKYDFDLTGRDSASTLAFLDRPFATNTVAGSLNGQSTPSSPGSSFRDRGVTLFGDSKNRRVNWGYSLGLFQGAGRGSDNNDAVAWVANLRAYPLKDLRLNLGLLSSDNRARGAAVRDRYAAWVAGASWEHPRAHLRAEYYSGTRHTSGDDRVDGFYLRGSVSPLPRLDLLARYQRVADRRLAPGQRQASSLDFGLRWYFTRKGARAGTLVAANYMARAAGDAFANRLTLLNDGRGPLLAGGALVEGVLAVRLQVQF